MKGGRGKGEKGGKKRKSIMHDHEETDLSTFFSILCLFTNTHTD